MVASCTGGLQFTGLFIDCHNSPRTECMLGDGEKYQNKDLLSNRVNVLATTGGVLPGKDIENIHICYCVRLMFLKIFGCMENQQFFMSKIALWVVSYQK